MGEGYNEQPEIPDSLSLAERTADPEWRSRLQEPVLRSILDYIDSRPAPEQRGYTSAPTGYGKTVLIHEIATQRPEQTLVVVPTNYLQRQTVRALQAKGFSGSIGIASGSRQDKGQYDMMVATYKGVVAQAKGFGFGLRPQHYRRVILDEAHNSMGAGISSVLRVRYGHAAWLGFTASEAYSETRQLRTILPDEIIKVTVREAANQGLLAPFASILMLTGADMSEVRINGNNYAARDMERTLNTPSHNMAVAQAYSRYLPDHKAIFNVGTVNHAEALAVDLRSQDVAAVAIHGSMSEGRQNDIIEQLHDGRLQAVVQAKLLGEGFDDPTVSLAINVTASLSRVVTTQRNGRPLRLDPHDPYKYALTVDCLDLNYRRTPLLYAHQDVADCVQAGWNQAFPRTVQECEQKIGQLDAAEGVTFVSEPDLVLGIANRTLRPEEVYDYAG